MTDKDIINRQKAEIERLEKHIVFEVESAYDRGCKAAIKEFEEKLDDLKKQKNGLLFYSDVKNLIAEMVGNKE